MVFWKDQAPLSSSGRWRGAHDEGTLHPNDTSRNSSLFFGGRKPGNFSPSHLGARLVQPGHPFLEWVKLCHMSMSMFAPSSFGTADPGAEKEAEGADTDVQRLGIDENNIGLGRPAERHLQP